MFGDRVTALALVVAILILVVILVAVGIEAYDRIVLAGEIRGLESQLEEFMGENSDCIPTIVHRG